MTGSGPNTIVLVHGAWHGGWCWRDVASILRARGWRVSAPTLTGLGERSHLMSRDIDLSVFVTDIVHHVTFGDLNDIVLVGHSFSGTVIGAAAERLAGRVRRLVYLDALLLESGETPMSRVPDDIAAERIRLAEQSSSGVSLPPPPASTFGIVDPHQQAWVDSHLTPHPLRAYLSSLTFAGRPGSGLPVDYIVCSGPLYLPLESSRERARAAGWQMHDLPTGHDAMVSAPNALADLLETSAGAQTGPRVAP